MQKISIEVLRMNWLYEEFRAIYMNVRLGILIWIKKPVKRKESPRIEVIHGVNKKVYLFQEMKVSHLKR